MTRKIVWVVISCLMTLSLVIASCDTQETATEEKETESKPAEVVITETTEGY